MKLFYLTILFFSTIYYTSQEFTCEAFCQNNDQPSYSDIFAKTFEERKQALEQFLKEEMEADEINNKKLEVVSSNDNQQLYFKLLEKCYDGERLFTYDLLHQLRSSKFNRLMFNHPFNDLNDNMATFLDQRYGRLLEWFKNPREKLIMNMLLHLGWRNYSKLKYFFRALPYNDIYAPILHFNQREIELIKYIDPTMHEQLKELNTDYERQYQNMSQNIFQILNDKGASTFLNYTDTERKMIKQDYIYARYIADIYTYYDNDEAYLLPHLPFEKEKFLKESQEDATALGIKRDMSADQLFVMPPGNMKTNSTLYRHYTHPYWHFYIYYGKIMKEHPQECQFITLWDFGINYGLAHITRFVPFPSYGICWKPDDEHKALLELLARLVNMNDEEALTCFHIAEHEQLIKKKKDLYQALIDQCPQVNLTKVDFRELGLKEIESKLFFIHKFNYFYKKEMNYAIKANNSLKIKNLEFLNGIAVYRKESLQDMKKYLIGMDWTNKTIPVKEIKYEEDEVDLEEGQKMPSDELDWELKKFENEKDEYKKKYEEDEEDDEEEEEEEESDEEILAKIKSPPYQKQMTKEFDQYKRKLKEEEARKAEEEEDRVREEVKQKKLSRKAAAKLAEEQGEEGLIDLDDNETQDIDSDQNQEIEEDDDDDDEEEEEDEDNEGEVNQEQQQSQENYQEKKEEKQNQDL